MCLKNIILIKIKNIVIEILDFETNFYVIIISGGRSVCDGVQWWWCASAQHDYIQPVTRPNIQNNAGDYHLS